MSIGRILGTDRISEMRKKAIYGERNITLLKEVHTSDRILLDIQENIKVEDIARSGDMVILLKDEDSMLLDRINARILNKEEKFKSLEGLGVEIDRTNHFKTSNLHFLNMNISEETIEVIINDRSKSNENRFGCI